MSTDIDIRQALRVFQIIVEQGERRGNRHYFKGIYATSGFDGYDVELTDEKVTLSIYFHSRFDLGYKNQLDKEAFLDRIAKIDALRKSKASE
ncbi:DUF3081 family protein [Kangiella koreensis]|uniref:DUF3081 domain-containing protein n=1 Tax=Kangiella koreensis (strain DSM 16069 / JCM 12317 / KCTC 12182 / SW-125) TaxID=523791 RepID=C7RA41_KANKD|nr:DUF3081 family protein [Kangiella koreensis]ACV26160.1 conserved hypothetical protein [Kangiella koreensis DSM 16069]